MFKRLFAAGLVFGAAALAPPALAQQQPACGPRDALVAGLADRYGERPAVRGLESPVRLMEILAAPETGTYTVLITRPNGLACVVAAGTHWQVAPGAEADRPAAAVPVTAPPAAPRDAR